MTCPHLALLVRCGGEFDCRCTRVSCLGQAPPVATKEAVQTGAYALVLMDCQLPEMDGFEATAMIRQLRAMDAPHLPIIAMTANTLPEDEATCLRAGMDDYLAKPAKLNKLKEVLEHWLVAEMIAA